MRLMNRFPFGTRHTAMTARAFVATEAVAIGVVSLIFIGVLLAITPYERRTAMLNRDLANLRQMGAWSANYGNDFEDLLPSLTSASSFGTPLQQAAGHAIDIIRRRSGRNTFPLPSSWLPHPLFSHLVLADYADRLLPDVMFVSTGDKHRLNWLDDPINKHDQGFWQPYQNPQGGTGAIPRSQTRFAYSGSFQVGIATFDQNQSRPGATLSRLSQTNHNSWSVPSVPLGGMKQSDVSYPGQKVTWHDYGAWHFSKQTQYFGHETARVATLMADGGASVKLTSDSNRGWIPNRATALLYPGGRLGTIGYYPRAWEPPNTEPGVLEHLHLRYRWTRGGLKGRDFDGPEIDTGQKR